MYISHFNLIHLLNTCAIYITNHSGGRVLIELAASTSLAPAGTNVIRSSSPLALCKNKKRVYYFRKEPSSPKNVTVHLVHPQ